MTVDERTVRDSLATYANGVVVTVSDVDRLHTDLHDRLGTRRPMRRRRLPIVAVLLLVIVIVAAATLWLRRPEPAIPANPQGFGPMPAITLDVDATGSNLTGWNPDQTWRNLFNPAEIVHPPQRPSLTWQLQPTILDLYFVDGQGQTCHAAKPWKAQSAGVVSFDSGPMVGPVCDAPESRPMISTWVSPASEAGRKLVPDTSRPTQPVTQAAQVDGVWLLQGTGLLLAFDDVPGATAGSDYVLDDDGDIDTAPDVRGTLSVAAGGQIRMTSSGCDDTLFGNAMTNGVDRLSMLTVRVIADPCQRFGSGTVLTWIRVL